MGCFCFSLNLNFCCFIHFDWLKIGPFSEVMFEPLFIFFSIYGFCFEFVVFYMHIQSRFNLGKFVLTNIRSTFLSGWKTICCIVNISGIYFF